MVAEPVNVTSDGKTHTIKAQYYKNGIANFVTNGGFGATGVAEPVAVASRTRENDDGSKTKRFEANGSKANCLTTVQTDCMVAEPVGGRIVGRRINEEGHRDDYNMDIELVQRFEVNENPQKTNCLTTVQKDNMIAEPVAVRCRGRRDADGNGYAKYEARSDSKSNALDTNTVNGSMVAEPILLNPKNEEGFEPSLQDCIYSADGKSTAVTGGFHPSVCVCEVRGMAYDLKEVYDADSGVVARLDMPRCHDILTRVYGENGKSPTITAQGGGNVEPKVFSSTESVKSTTETPVYEVKDGKITIKGKQYPIKLADGHYIIRKLTVDECKRLQTVPEWYDMTCISNTQAYKCLGNGWTIEVIAHLIRGALNTPRGVRGSVPSPSPIEEDRQSSLDRWIGGE